MKFVLAGKRYRLTRDGVIQSVRGEEPREIRRYYIEIEGKKYPPKQVFELATGLRPVEFTTMHAVGILKKLCFELREHRV